MMAGISNEERKAFMTQMSPEQTADTKGEEDGEFFVEKVIKMRVNKVGMEEFLVQWAGYPLSEATWEPFEHLSGEEAREYPVFLLIQNFTILVNISISNILFKGEEALSLKKGRKGTDSSQVKCFWHYTYSHIK